MSNLKAHAISSEKVMDLRNNAPDDERAIADEWVPFEDAQKELTDLKDNARRQVWDLTVQVNNLEAKIKAAKEILREFEAFDPSTAEWLERLKNALLIPRIEKQETADPVAELMKQGKC